MTAVGRIGAARIGEGRAGRPLRFLAATMLGWTAFRVAVLWPGIDSVPALIRAVAPPLAAAELPPGLARVSVPLPAAAALRRPALPAPSAGTASPASRPADPALVALALAALVRYGEAVPLAHEPVQEAVPVLPPPLGPVAARSSRWSGSAWAIARPDGRAGEVIGGSQLGGSQAGARIAYALGDARRVALAARFATPLEGPGRELGLGAEMRVAPGVRVVAEQRLALDGGRGGPSLSAAGGVGPVPVGGFRLEAYGQAGAVRRRRLEPFADGAARVARPLAAAGAAARLDLGLGAWGGAQRDAARLDLGPTLGASLPVAAGRALRLTLDWRQRVAGDARPRSGLALSAGLDF